MTDSTTRADTGRISVPAAGDGGAWTHRPGKRMICLDVDGTLIDYTGEMSGPVRQAARDLVAQGHLLVVATGRSLPATLPVIEQLGITHGYAVCSNGGVTVRIDLGLEDNYEVIERRVFDPAPALEALAERLPTARYAIETSAGTFLSTERFQDMSFGLVAQGTSFAELKRAEAVRLVVNSDSSTAEEFGEAVKGIGLQGVTYSVGWSAWLDVAAAGVTKASGLEPLREKMQVPLEDTLAVGDGRNDIEMLSWAGLGVAMGQAPQEVLDTADQITGTIEDDGLAAVLESVLRE